MAEVINMKIPRAKGYRIENGSLYLPLDNGSTLVIKLSSIVLPYDLNDIEMLDNGVAIRLGKKTLVIEHCLEDVPYDRGCSLIKPRVTVEVLRVVRDITKLHGCSVVYKRSNGYFQKGEFDGDEWQFGRDAFDMQVLHAQMKNGEKTITNEEAMKIIENYCGLMSRAAYMRACYNNALEVIEGKAEFRDE